MPHRCELTELIVEMCSHCTGADPDYARPYTGAAETPWTMGAWDE
jgi:hypothetical protein